MGWTQADLDAYYEKLKQDPEGIILNVVKKSRQLGVTATCPTLDPTIIIEIRGRIPSKKNRYSPRKDRPGFFKNSKLEEELGRIAMQIPGQYRDLKLESPTVDFFFYYTRANWDRDNAAQCLTDLLVEYGVLKNDNIRRFNGTVTIHPALLSEYDGVTVAIRPA